MPNPYERGGGQRSGGPSNDTRGSRSKRSIFRRTVFLMVACGGLMFVPLIWKLWDIAIVHHEEYQEMASDQQEMDLAVTASRGDIYDANGNVLAMSATVYDLILSPRDLIQSISKNKYETEDGELDEAAYQAAIQERRELIADKVSAVLGLEREDILKRMEKTNSAYEVIKKNIEGEQADQLLAFLAEEKLGYSMQMVPGTKRYYPYSSLAAQALGFVNDEGGAVGLEAWYNDLLEGTAGRVVTTKTAAGTEMYNSYSNYIDAVDGYDLTLTIDATIQSYLEKTLEEGIKEFDVRNGAFAIAMDPNTGAIKGIASSPDFDPNSYSAIVDSILSDKMEKNADTIYDQLKEANDQLPAGSEEKLTDEELRTKAKGQAYSAAVNTQWRSKAIDSTYEPGSTFKAIVLAAALEEGLVDENDTFYCSGSVVVGSHTIHCSKRQGHKSQTLAEAVQNSCNPAFIAIGQRLGTEKFWKYFQAFGMTETTGIDLPGEANGLNWDADMSIVDLAVASFGQRFTVTPLQMICGFAATINGGDLVKPYVVQSVRTKDGTVVQNTEPTVVRQVVSQETSRRAAAILESVVADGTGGNAYVAGYRIGGKTGSSETDEEDRTIVSFMGFAPADDPQVIVLLAYDRPEPRELGVHCDWSTTGVYISGGNMAAKKAGPLIAQILDHMGVEKKYSAEESAAVDVAAPRVTGKTVSAAQTDLGKKGLKYRTIGEGDTVSRQVPAAGAQVPRGSTVILYLGDAAPEETGTVPNITGLTYEAARSKLENAGFFMRASGVSVYYGNSTTAESQSIPGGQEAAIGTVVDVSFFNVVEDGSVGVQ